jgi:hypothetical protein
VGAWVQNEDQVVRLRLLEDVTLTTRAALERTAARLTEWLAGDRVFTVYPSPAMRDNPIPSNPLTRYEGMRGRS